MNLTGFWAKATRDLSGEGSPGGVTPAAEPVVTPEPVAAPAAPVGPDLSWAGDDFLDNGALKADDFRSHVETLRAEKAARDEALAKVPEAYEFKAPDDLVLELPPGIAVTLDPTDPTVAPIYGELSAFLKEIGAPAEAGAKLAGLVLRSRAAEAMAKYNAAVPEWEALGANEAERSNRLETLKRSLEGRLPSAQAAAVNALAGSKDAVIGLEALLNISGPRTTPPTPTIPAADPLAARYPSMKL